MSKNKQKFRPSARLISTIGENLIKDNYAAVVELVKNSYDADATIVNIVFKSKGDNVKIIIEDNGIGMSPETIVEKWLVPSTNDKLIRKVSQRGRFMQGEKGIGRFSAAILGEKLNLETVCDSLITTIEINWNDFTSDKFLDQIEIELITEKTNKKNGTKFEIECLNGINIWNKSSIEYLEKELRKMITPIDNRTDDEFKINLIFEDFFLKEYSNTKIEIEPYPLLNYYNYRIFGKVFNDGKSNIEFEYYKNDKLKKENVSRDIILPKDLDYCGTIEFDFRVFERDKENLIKMFKNDEFIFSSIDSMKQTEIKRLLDKICGISIYKNDFRIRPYGDEGYDWLELDKKRVQDPSHKIGFNQISGTIKIEAENKSGLWEKSARDGIREDSHYHGFKYIISTVIEILEIKRTNLKKSKKEEKSTILTINNDYLKEKITEVAKESGLPEKDVDKIEKIIDEDTKIKDEKINELTHQISKYEGQATLGKIMDLIMHEVRKPLMWFKTQSSTIEKKYDRYLTNPNSEDLEQMIKIIEKSKMHAKLISDFFNKIDILATRSNEEKEEYIIYEVINDSIEIFDSTLKSKGITVDINCNELTYFYGWKKDLIMALSNIIENSIHWISNFDVKEKKIFIDVNEYKEKIIITIEDTGIGIAREVLEDDILFKPGISTKYKGTGIGLAIVGNCLERNNGHVEAYNTRKGACIKLTLMK